MKQTNLFIQDMLDFDSPGAEGDVLWKAVKPKAVFERGNAVVLEVPFQAQKQGGDYVDKGCFSPAAGIPQKTIEVIVRAYGDSIVRISAAFSGTVPGDSGVMLEWDDSLKPEQLKAIATGNGWEIVDTKQAVRFKISREDWKTREWGGYSSECWDEWLKTLPLPTETLNAAVIPDGKIEIPFWDFDTFLPTLHNSIGMGYVEREGRPDRCAFSVKAGSDEKFAGTGERFAKMDLSGRTMILENIDARGVNGKDAYKNVPFFVSSRPYGLLMLTPAHVRLSLADISTRAAQAVIEDSILDLFFIGGGSLERVVYNYRRITGFPRMMPVWSYGSWISRCTYHSEEETLKVAEKLREEKFPFEVLHLDPGWFEKFWKCDWKFSASRFPDPEAYFKKMREMGFRVCLWNFPTVEKDTSIYDEACKKGYLPVKKRNGNMVEYGTSIDFTNPEAVEWYKRMLKEVLKMGASVIKTDFGETIDMDAEYHAMPARLFHNLNALLYQKAAFEAVEEVKGEGIIWARAGWVGCQRYPVHWGGDCAATWDGLAGTIRGGLHMGLTGFAFWSHDVSGFLGIPDIMNVWPENDLYVRWTQVGVFTSHIRYHGSQPREPYEYPEVAGIIRRWLQLRYAFIPYLIDESKKTIGSGYPIFRATVFHHEDDRACWAIDDQFYCGDSLLIAPVINKAGIRDVYLPEGEWSDLWTGEQIKGPVTLKKREIPLDRIPVYAKTGSTIRVYPNIVQCTDEMDFSKAVMLRFDSSYHGLEKSVLGDVFCR